MWFHKFFQASFCTLFSFQVIASTSTSYSTEPNLNGNSTTSRRSTRISFLLLQKLHLNLMLYLFIDFLAVLICGKQAGCLHKVFIADKKIDSFIIVSFISSSCDMLVLVSWIALLGILHLEAGKQSCPVASWGACRWGLLRLRACYLAVLALCGTPLVLNSSGVTW